MQTVPTHIDIAELKKKILEKVNVVLAGEVLFVVMSACNSNLAVMFITLFIFVMHLLSWNSSFKLLVHHHHHHHHHHHYHHHHHHLFPLNLKITEKASISVNKNCITVGLYCGTERRLSASDPPPNGSWSYRATSSAPMADGLSVWLVRRSGIPCRTACGIRLLAGTGSDNLWRRFCFQRTDAYSTLEVSRRCAI